MRLIFSTLLVYVIAAGAVSGLQLLAVTVLLSWRAGSVDLERNGLAILLTGVPASSLALIAIALLAAGRPRRVTLRLVPGRATARAIAAMVVGMLALSQALESLALLVGVGPGPALDWMARTLASAPPLGLLLAVVVVGLLAPVGEELFFRGYMLTRLRRTWRAGPAILVTALAFGIIHGEWVHGVLAAGIGIFLGIVAERSASVVPAVICHAANNTASVVLSAVVGSPEGRGSNAVLLVLAALVFAASLVWLRRLTPPPAV
jgi:membrane protease YdiL (CAAX protease family)